MKPSAHTLRGPPGGPASRALPARLLHTLFVFCATSLMMVIAVIVFLFVLFFRTIVSGPGQRRASRHVKFLESSIVIPIPPTSGAAAEFSPANGTPSLSLTATPRELEPPTPDVAEDPLRALTRICGFLASNTALAWRGEALNATPPLAGLALYLDAVHEDVERINEMVADDKGGGDARKGEETVTVGGAKDRESAGGGSEPAPAAGESAGAGAGADAHNEPVLVRPDQAATHARRPPPPPPPPTSQSQSHARRPPPPLPPIQLPTAPPVPVPSTIPTPPAPEPSTAQSASDMPSAPTLTTTNSTSTLGPRKRKDAVLRTKRPSIDPSNADALADADDAAVRVAALLSRVTDLGAGLFDGGVRERGAALWTALSHRTPEVPVPSLPRTRFAAPPASGAEL